MRHVGPRAQAQWLWHTGLAVPKHVESLLAELKASAESGWDFSSRWLVGGVNPSSLSSIRTSKLVPVDLNAFLCQAEGLMSYFYSRLGARARREGKKGASPAWVPASASAVALQGGP